MHLLSASICMSKIARVEHKNSQATNKELNFIIHKLRE